MLASWFLYCYLLSPIQTRKGYFLSPLDYITWQNLGFSEVKLDPLSLPTPQTSQRHNNQLEWDKKQELIFKTRRHPVSKSLEKEKARQQQSSLLCLPRSKSTHRPFFTASTPPFSLLLLRVILQSMWWVDEFSPRGTMSPRSHLMFKL